MPTSRLRACSSAGELWGNAERRNRCSALPAAACTTAVRSGAMVRTTTEQYTDSEGGSQTRNKTGQGGQPSIGRRRRNSPSSGTTVANPRLSQRRKGSAGNVFNRSWPFRPTSQAISDSDNFRSSPKGHPSARPDFRRREPGNGTTSSPQIDLQSTSLFLISTRPTEGQSRAGSSSGSSACSVSSLLLAQLWRSTCWIQSHYPVRRTSAGVACSISFWLLGWMDGLQRIWSTAPTRSPRLGQHRRATEAPCRPDTSRNWPAQRPADHSGVRARLAATARGGANRQGFRTSSLRWRARPEVERILHEAAETVGQVSLARGYFNGMPPSTTPGSGVDGSSPRSG